MTAHYSDGSTDDQTANAAWTVANPLVGLMNGATLVIPTSSVVAVQTSLLTARVNGVSGEAQITVIAHAETGPKPDVLFVLPFEDPSGPASRSVALSTRIHSLDVFVLAATTGSMGGAIQNISSGLVAQTIPGILSVADDAQFGVGTFQDFPISPYGSPNDCGAVSGSPDQPFILKQAITNNLSALQTATASLNALGCGADVPDSALEAVYQVGTGQGLNAPAPTSVPPNHTGVGGVGYRPDAVPVVVDISNYLSHGVGETGSCSTTGDPIAYTGAVAAVAHSRQQAKDALAGICARMVGVDTIVGGSFSSCSGESYMTDSCDDDWGAGASERVGRRDAARRLHGGTVLHGGERRGPGPRPQRSLSSRVRGRRERHRGSRRASPTPSPC